MAIETCPKFVTSQLCVPLSSSKIKKSKNVLRNRRRRTFESKKLIALKQRRKLDHFRQSNSHLSCAPPKSKNSDPETVNTVEIFTMQDSEMSDIVKNVCFEHSSEIQTCDGKLGSRFSSPIEDSPSRSSKSPNSIEDLNKEIERLFLNNERFGLNSILWDKEEVAEGRRAPIADMLHCYKNKGYNRRKKRRSATVLGIRNYNESDSSNGISSPDDNSGCEEYCKTKIEESSDPEIIIPVPVGKSDINRTTAVNFSGPFSSSKLQLSEDSAFAPIKTISRCQSTPPEEIEIDNDENKLL